MIKQIKMRFIRGVGNRIGNAAGMLCVFGALVSCNQQDMAIKEALRQAGDNRGELEYVLEYYKDNADKLACARFLIANMPAHYSYAGNAIDSYYAIAKQVFADTVLTPEQQRDSLLAVTDRSFADLPNHTVPDTRIITADFLIRNIDAAYRQWKECPWARQAAFSEFCEYLLPYKAVELQSLDAWRDTLQNRFTDGVRNMEPDDEQYGTAMGVADIVRGEVQNKMQRNGLYTRSGLPLLRADLLPVQTFGNIPDYALVGALALRSAGVPTALYETPVGARDVAATRWFAILDDRGQLQTTEWDVSSGIGWEFFPYERGPKVFQMTYAMDARRLEYKKNAKYQHPFELARKDVTNKYFLTANLELPVEGSIRRQLKDRYVYIASAVRDSVDWCIVDFGRMHHGKACFDNMGREVMYRGFGYDGHGLIPITDPFILHKDCSVEYVDCDSVSAAGYDYWRNNTI